MTELTASLVSQIPATIGLDVGDTTTHACVLTSDDKIRRLQFPTTREGLLRALRPWTGVRIVLEAGSQSPWISWALKDAGYDVRVVDPRRVKHITEDRRKTDKRDAEMLARLGRASYLDPCYLPEIHHRGEQAQADLAIVRARDGLVDARTQTIQQIRSLAKNMGVRLPSSSTKSFAKNVAEDVPAKLRPAIDPLLEVVKYLTEKITDYERLLEQIASERYSEVEKLRAIPGVGPLTSLTYVLTIEDPTRFSESRKVGSLLGLCPRKNASGDKDPDLPITKAGNPYLRRLLTQSAHCLLARGKDCDLKRFGQRMLERGSGKGRRRKVIIAIARKLAVLMHTLLVSGKPFDPDYLENRRQAKAA